MKRVIQALVAFAVVVICLASQASAANLQGFKWAVTSGDKVNAHWTCSSTGFAVNFDESMYMQMPNPDPISTTVNQWSDIPIVTPELKWSNGSTVFILFYLLFGGLLPFGARFVVPIGNWSLLTILVDKIPGWNINTTMVVNSAYWGMTLTYLSSGMTYYQRVLYLKSDGVLARYDWTITDSTTHVTIDSVSLVRDNLPSDIIVALQDNILYIGIGVAILVLLVLACKRR